MHDTWTGCVSQNSTPKWANYGLSGNQVHLKPVLHAELFKLCISSFQLSQYKFKYTRLLSIKIAQKLEPRGREQVLFSSCKLMNWPKICSYYYSLKCLRKVNLSKNMLHKQSFRCHPCHMRVKQIYMCFDLASLFKTVLLRESHAAPAYSCLSILWLHKH